MFLDAFGYEMPMYDCRTLSPLFGTKGLCSKSTECQESLNGGDESTRAVEGIHNYFSGNSIWCTIVAKPELLGKLRPGDGKMWRCSEERREMTSAVSVAKCRR